MIYFSFIWNIKHTCISNQWHEIYLMIFCLSDAPPVPPTQGPQPTNGPGPTKGPGPTIPPGGKSTMEFFLWVIHCFYTTYNEISYLRHSKTRSILGFILHRDDAKLGWIIQERNLAAVIFCTWSGFSFETNTCAPILFDSNSNTKDNRFRATLTVLKYLCFRKKITRVVPVT